MAHVWNPSTSAVREEAKEENLQEASCGLANLRYAGEDCLKNKMDRELMPKSCPLESTHNLHPCTNTCMHNHQKQGWRLFIKDMNSVTLRDPFQVSLHVGRFC